MGQNTRVSSSYFFLFFGLLPIFLLFSREIPIFRVLLCVREHFEIFEIKFSVKLVSASNIKKLSCQKKKTPENLTPAYMISKLSIHVLSLNKKKVKFSDNYQCSVEMP